MRWVIAPTPTRAIAVSQMSCSTRRDHGKHGAVRSVKTSAFQWKLLAIFADTVQDPVQVCMPFEKATMLRNVLVFESRSIRRIECRSSVLVFPRREVLLQRGCIEQR